MGFWSNYALFIIKLVTFSVIILLVIAIIVAIISKTKGKEKEKTGTLSLRSLNEHYQEMATAINQVIQTKAWKKLFKKQNKKATKSKEKRAAVESESMARLFVINFSGDIRASTLPSLREEVTGILLTADPKKDQVLIRLESQGGMVHAYGLASSQLQRLKDSGIRMTVSVDKVAASGGYMMACIADEIIAAPFAIIGSIGVIAQLPNFNRYLEKKNIDFEQILAGKYKRTLTMFGKNTQEGREKMQAEVEDTHELFKEFIAAHRPQINLEEVATGEHWFGMRAKELKLIDKLQTSDDYLLTAKNNFAMYEIEYSVKKPFIQKFTSMVSIMTDKLLLQRFPT